MGQIAEFKDRIREVMGDMTQTDLARKMNVAQQTIQRYMSGERTPKIEKIYTIANLFGVNPLWLAGYDVPKYSKDTTATPSELTITNSGGGNLIAPVDSTNTIINNNSRGEYTEQEYELIEMYKRLSLVDRAKVVSFIAELLDNQKRGKR